MPEELVVGSGAVEEAGDGSPTTGTETEQRQPKQPEVDLSKINLDELPAFRQWKSAADRRVATLERELQRQRQEAAGLQQQQRQLAKQHLPPEEQATFELAEAQREIQRLQGEIQRQQSEQQAWGMINRIASATGTDAQELAEDFFVRGLDADAIWEKAIKKARGTSTGETKKAEPKAQAPKVDVGNGRPRTNGDVEEQIRNAKSAKDLARLLIPRE